MTVTKIEYILRMLGELNLKRKPNEDIIKESMDKGVKNKNEYFVFSLRFPLTEKEKKYLREIYYLD